MAQLVEAPRCATSRKVAGSIPDGVTEKFHLHNISGRSMSLGSTEPLTERGPVRRAEKPTALQHSGFDCPEIWELHLPGILWA